MVPVDSRSRSPRAADTGALPGAGLRGYRRAVHEARGASAECRGRRTHAHGHDDGLHSPFGNGWVRYVGHEPRHVRQRDNVGRRCRNDTREGRLQGWTETEQVSEGQPPHDRPRQGHRRFGPRPERDESGFHGERVLVRDREVRRHTRSRLGVHARRPGERRRSATAGVGAGRPLRVPGRLGRAITAALNRDRRKTAKLPPLTENANLDWAAASIRSRWP